MCIFAIELPARLKKPKASQVSVMNVIDTTTQDLKNLRPALLGDRRDFFIKIWRRPILDKKLPKHNFFRNNQSLSRRMILRRSRYLIQIIQGELVRQTNSEAFDVENYLGKSYATNGQWVSFYCSGRNHRHLWISDSLAHCSLGAREILDLNCKITTHHHHRSEHSLLWNDTQPKMACLLRKKSYKPSIAQKDIEKNFLDDCPVF